MELGRKGPERVGRSGVFQYDLHDDVAGVTAAIDDLFDHFQEVLEDDKFLGIVGAVVELLELFEHDLVGFTFGPLEA